MKSAVQPRIEWALLCVIAAVCGGLSYLQYHWTGELSRAERARLHEGLVEQVRRGATAFNDQLRDSSIALLPTVAELEEHGSAEAHRQRYLQWVASHDRNIFRWIGVATPEPAGLKLYQLGADGSLVVTSWPADLHQVRDAMEARLRGQGPPPFTPRGSSYTELPVTARRDGGEREWMILEVNEEYARTRIFPDLVSKYLNIAGEPLYEASVTRNQPGTPVVFSTREDHVSVLDGAEATAPIFPARMPNAAVFNTSGPAGRRGRRGGRGGEEGRDRWTLAVRPRAGAVESAITRARTQNLLTSLLLIGLLGGAAWALVRYTARSRRLADMQFRFAAGVSHDLRTPLTAIRGAAFNLADKVVQEPAAVEKYARLILRNAEELTAMIENVLAFSASMHSKVEARREAFAIGDLLEHAAAALASEIERAGCHIEVTIAPGLPAVEGDPEALDHAFRNLIQNAVRHAASGRWIGVSAARRGNDVEVRICDRGPGIPDSERASIFDPFYRGEQSRAIRVPGTGLGLSLVRETVERHRGTVSVNNASGGGAQFTLLLPGLPETA